MEVHVFKQFWRSKAHTNVLAFFWQVLMDKAPAKMNLFKRKTLVDQQDLVFVLCNTSVEH